MKNRLLALMALCGATSSTLPLWAAWEDPELQFVDPNLTADETGGGVYYIYHVATQKFMTNGQPYGTRLVVAETGQEVTLSYGEDYELANLPETSENYFAGKGWRLSMMNAPTNGGYHELFINPGGAEIYVDHNKTGHILWKIVKEGDVYRIKVIDEDKLYGVEANGGLYANSYMAVNEGKTTVDPLIDKNTAGYENAKDEWKFVAPETYEVFQAKKLLKVQLEAADAIGFTEYADYAALYNQADATVEAIEKAVEDLKADIIDFGYSVATEENPLDVTEKFVKEASFANSTDGWDIVQGSGANYQRKTGDRFENGAGSLPEGLALENFYECATNNGSNMPDWSIKQKIEGIPDGKYRVGAWILTNKLPTEDAPNPKGIFLYAQSLAGEKKVEATDPADAANAGRGNGTWHHYTVDVDVIGGIITIGYVVQGANSTWSAVDNFTLEYMGKSGSGEVNIREILNQNIESAEAQYAEYTGANKAFSESEKVKYEEMIAAAKEAYQNQSMDSEALTGVITSLFARMDTLANNVAAYETLAQKIEALNKAYDETPYANDGLEDYEVYLDEVLQAGYDNGTFDIAELDSVQPRADRIFRESVMKALADGTTDNVTGLMVNPNFAGSNDGWTKTGDGDFKNDGTRVSEVWNGRNWEVYQEISGLPQGSYKITMQGFYSPSSRNDNAWHEGWGQEGDETNKILGYLFGNDASEPLLHVTACPQEENVAENCEEVTWTGDASLAGKWLCHGKNSAQEIFEQNSENYLNATTCYVGEDGKLRIGVKMSGVSWGQAWVIFDNFQVEYLGAGNMEGAQTALDALIREANGMLASDVLTTQEAKDGLSKAIEAASAVGELTPEVYKEQTESLNAAIKFGQESMDAAAALEIKVTAHDAKLSSTGEASYGDYSDTEGYEELYDLTIEVFDKIDGEGIFATLDEINDYSLRLDKAYSKMLSGHIDFTTASKDEPVDATGLIVNPSFQTKTENDKGEIVDAASADGWFVESLKGGSGVKDAKIYEIFSDSSEVYQPLYNAPAGYYRVVMNGFYRAGGFIDAGVARRDSADAQNAELFVKCGDGNWSEKLPSIFEHVSELKYDGSDVALPDSLFPESNMLYHFIVNQPAGAKLAFEDNAYEVNFSFYVAEGKEPVLGVRKTGMLTNDWTCFDNFRLYYLGDGDANKPDDFESGIGGVAADGTATVISSAWYTINGVRVAEPKQRGIYIRQDMMSDGTKKTVKVLVK